MRALLILNPKGGSGKTTLATNVAGALASLGEDVELLDLDRQKSASQWLARRPANLPAIRLMNDPQGSEKKSGWLVVDTPAALHGKTLDHALRLAHRVLVPVAPSLFDIQASRDFLHSLAAEKAVRKGRTFVGVVGMRMAPRTRAAVTLEGFLRDLDLPVLGYLREAQNYVNAAFEGKTLFDLPPSQSEIDRAQWAELLVWLRQGA